MSYKLVTDINQIKKLLDDYFIEIITTKGALIEALQSFSKKEGFGIAGKSILFLNDLDESDEAYARLGNDKVLLSVDEATSSANEDIEAYLSFSEFYKYLKSQVEKVSMGNREEKLELENVLLKVKKGLAIE
ncbi:ribonuclease toxin immunity protein CdiI [Bacillus pseudomycoides]|uniref:ribonuclease toxin immunity protein CdiI n=1 Tax=Bacillus pseudomycoides TaxID=64104 RepID=UPI000BEE3D73|nr:hypothetical protein [Bacillus pseudomycoides]PEE39730.1 hypothetical protein COO02_17615 [Bacillus pseudomycoides]PEI95631.1 hypothetical protein CN679_02580 [Bacillus pseudomycoides]PGA90659.1 hypothetical protein COL91_14300 [Bacillus pseudomycoides]PHF40777.1 hypothetical protein COF72_21345 [Bacillus pseudomycoides]